MEKNWIIGIGLLGIIIVGTIIFSSGQHSMNFAKKSDGNEQPFAASTTDSNIAAGRVSHNLIMTAATAKPVETILVYKTLPPVVNNESTLALAKKFNVTGTLREGAVVQSKDLRFGVEVSKNSGSVIYSDQDRPNEAMDSPEKLPSDEEAVKIATQFLKDRELLPEGAYFSGTEREYARSTDKSGKEMLHYGVIIVWYGRHLNGLNVEGTKISLDIEGGGDVGDYYSNWRNYEQYKEYPIISPDDAFNQLKEKGVGVGMNDKDAMVSIDDVYLAYHSKAGAYKEDYLEPVWMFKGDVHVDGKAVMPVQAYVPALTEESVKSLSSS